MREITLNIVRGLCLAAVLTAGSCTVPITKDADNFDDPLVNHPLLVEPSYQSMKVSYAAGAVDPASATKLEAFIADYRTHGNGKIAINVPSGPAMQQTVVSLSNQINEMGISRDRILVASHDAAAGPQVEINYISYQAHSTACGDDWSENLAFTADNNTARNLGCSNQHNLAAMVSDPRDLLGPRPMDGGDATRRHTVVGNYETGKVSGAEKSSDQKVSITDVGH